VEIVVATKNKKKLEEIGRILEGTNIRLLSLDDFPGCPEAEETGETFEENALIKSRSVAGYTGKPAISDDSGLEAYALGGSPGIRSARYAGEGATDRENLNKLLWEMDGVPADKRGARFVCVIALSWPDGNAKTFTGAVEGEIGTEPKGRRGFGYDPVFYPEGHGRTFAEMRTEEKDSMSHRARALEKLREFLLKEDI
jgi:XTP/dITP diphosphohydrolase